MRKGTLLYCVLPAVAGLALIAVAVLLSSWSPGGRVVASAQALGTTNLCQLQVDKEGSRTESDGNIFVVSGTGTAPVTGDNLIEYTITVTNVGQQDCPAIEVVDQLPEGLTCLDVSVETKGVSDDPGRGCGNSATESGGNVTKAIFIPVKGPFSSGQDVVVTLIASDNTDENCVTNRACAEGALTDAGLQDNALVNGTCDQDTVCRRHPRTPTTPTPTVTNTPVPPTATPVVPRPTATAKPLATLVPPKTGTGSESGSSPWLLIGLGLGGVCLLLVSGAAVAKRRVR